MTGEVTIVRYRYRAYPGPGQVQALARAFGCARVGFNDTLRARDEAYAAGERIGDTDVQRRVVTLAKQTPEGFGVTPRGVRAAKVGVLRLAWSRALPSVPSSATVIRQADGRYYVSFVVSFVVDVVDVPFPVVDAEVGLDPGLGRLATLSSGEIVANPRPLRSRHRGLARARRALARRRKESVNRRKAVRRVAVEHRKAREARRDHHHTLAARLVRDSRAVHVEGQRQVAAGRKDGAATPRRAGMVDACGADVRPGPVRAAGRETGTHRGAA